VANAASVAICSVLNFFASDRFVFRMAVREMSRAAR